MLPTHHDYPFDPTYGCDRAALAAIVPPPAPVGFDAFWRATRAAADAVPLRLQREAATSPTPGWRLSIVRFDSLGGFRVGAWLLEPEGDCRAGVVAGHGYGGRDTPPLVDPAWPQPEPTAVLAPCMPGFHLSAVAGTPAMAGEHVVHGIASPETYLLRFCVAALWSATRALVELRPETAGRLAYEGGSFGGGLGALAAPWEPLWSCARLDVPTFGHHPWRLRCPCNGSGEAVRRLHAQRPEIADTLAFFDAAVAATRAHLPGFIVPALFDPAVPPPGQWAVANAWAGLRVIGALSTGHHDGPWTPAQQRAQHDAWITMRRTYQLG
jgi:cephalosporin-C deacetylase